MSRKGTALLLMAVHHTAQKPLFDDALYCEDEKWAEFEQEESEITSNHSSLFPSLLSERDFFWDEEELQSLFRKDGEASLKSSNGRLLSLSSSRKQGVEWILRANSHHGFSALTAILAVNFLDRFLVSCSNYQRDEPWMMQLVAVASLSLAAKVEETHVPLLVDLQVEDAKYLFEAKTIQRTELLILTALKWRMNPVTPLSFLDHIVRRLGLMKSRIYWDFVRSCENLILSLIAVVAAATMVHVINQDEPNNIGIEYENQLLALLRTSKDEVDGCCKFVSAVLSQHNKSPSKHKICETEQSN